MPDGASWHKLVHSTACMHWNSTNGSYWFIWIQCNVSFAHSYCRATNYILHNWHCTSLKPFGGSSVVHKKQSLEKQTEIITVCSLSVLQKAANLYWGRGVGIWFSVLFPPQLKYWKQRELWFPLHQRIMPIISWKSSYIQIICSSSVLFEILKASL